MLPKTGSIICPRFLVSLGGVLLGELGVHGAAGDRGVDRLAAEVRQHRVNPRVETMSSSAAARLEFSREPIVR
jgi:hypothetical protein